MSEENLYQITGTVRIKKGQGRSLKSGGAWIYDNEIDAVTDGFVNGGLVRVEDFDGYPPVSYTHLDVYKRQTFSLSSLAPSRSQSGRHCSTASMPSFFISSRA